MWLLIVLLFRNSFWKASCSVMYRGLLQERTGTERRDFFELAHKGTLFLDEISEIPSAFRENCFAYSRNMRSEG